MNTQKPNEQEQIVETPTEARQGRRTFGLRVLVISTALIVVVFAALYLFAEISDRNSVAEVDEDTPITQIEPPPNVPPAY